MARKMEIRLAEGLADLLAQMVLTTPNSRTFEPNADILEQVIRLGNAFIESAAQIDDNAGTTVFATHQWPENGPAVLALAWALNTRHPYEFGSANSFFFRAFTETKETTEQLLSRYDMEYELGLYSVQQFGRPRSV